MSTSETWPLIPPTPPAPTPPTAVSGVGVATVPAYQRAYLGHCIFRPLRRDRKADFANTGGVELVAAAVVQVIGTIAETGLSRGELPWDTDFGSALALLHHRNPNETFEDLANIYVIDAIQRWEPRAIVTGSSIETKIIDGESHVYLRVLFDVASSNTPGSEIVARDLVASVYLS